MALYEERSATQRENGQLLVWHCRYCLSQVTYREKSSISPPKAEPQVIEEIPPVKVIEAPYTQPIEQLPASSEMSPISSPPSLTTYPEDQTVPAREPSRRITKQAQVAKALEIEHPLTETDSSIIPHESSFRPLELEPPERPLQDQPSSYERRIKSILDEMEKVRAQNEKLERRISLLTRRKSFIIGSGLLVTSFFGLIFAYITKEILLEGMSIGAFFFGVSLLLLSSERYVKSDVAALATISPLLSLHAMLQQLGGRTPAVYLPPIQDEKIGKLFVPWESNEEISFPTFEEVSKENVFIPEKGALLLPIGSQLLTLMEEELDVELIRGSLKNTLQIIQKTLTLKTGLSQRAEFIVHGPNQIELVLTGAAYSQICKESSNENNLCDLLGCPICSMIASLIAKTTGEPVIMEKSGYDLETDTTRINFQIRGWTISRFGRRPPRYSRDEPTRMHSTPKTEEDTPTISKKQDSRYEEHISLGYCPICEILLDPKTNRCPNCGFTE